VLFRDGDGRQFALPVGWTRHRRAERVRRDGGGPVSVSICHPDRPVAVDQQAIRLNDYKTNYAAKVGGLSRQKLSIYHC